MKNFVSTIGIQYPTCPTGATGSNGIPGGSGLAAVYIVDQSGGNMYNVIKDHLGSITGLVDENGSLGSLMTYDNTNQEFSNEFSYDAWGRRRHPDSWVNFTTPELLSFSPLISRGFTGHEHMDSFGLINMNGRIYDPLIARFLSPDNYAEPSSQGLKRYSYCLNNPMKYTDPSGEDVWSTIGTVMNFLVKQKPHILCFF